MMKSVEIFSGVGGLAQGLKMAGFQHEALVEWNNDACNSLRINFEGEKVYQEDIRNFDFKLYSNVDLISGGPPCQPFSLGGKHKGKMDKRDMFPYAINGIREIQPKAFIFENVKGLLRQSFASYFNYIILQLTYPEVYKREDEEWLSHLSRLEKIHTSGSYTGLKYNVVYRLVNAADYGIPQKRERVIIVGIKDSLKLKWSFPDTTHSFESLLWSKFVTGEYWDKFQVSSKNIEIPNEILQRKIERLKFRYGMFEPEKQPWVTVRQAIGDLPPPMNENEANTDHIYRDGAKAYPGHTGSYIDEPSKTIKAGGHGVPGGENMIRYENDMVRYFTVLEAKRIQTFPDDYVITGSWSEAMRQLGNAVPVKLAHLMGAHLFERLYGMKVRSAYTYGD